MSKKQTKASRKRPDVSPTAPGTEAAAPGSGEARTAPVRPSPAPGRPPADPEPPLRIGWSAPLRYAILGVLLFLVIALQAGGNDRAAAVGMSLVLIACVFGRMPQWSLRHRLSIPVLAVFAYLLLNSAAGLYSRFGSFAAGEFGKILCAFCVFCVVLLRARRGEARYLAAMASAVSAVFGLISIDGSSLKLLSSAFIRVMDGALGCYYASLSTGYESGIRVTGIFGNANVLAGFLALGVFLALYLIRTAGSRRTRLGGCMLLFVNSLSFLLAFSMGAIGMFAVAVLFYLLAERKGLRFSLFLLMVETAVAALLMAFLSFAGLGKTGAMAALPVCAALLGGVLLWALHEFVGLPLSQRLSAHGRTAGLVVAGLAGLLCVYAVLAFNVTGGYALTPGETLRRSVYPAPGDYTLEGDWSGGVQLTVESQNKTETIMHTSTVLYSGPLDGAAFTVPEDSTVVYLDLSAQDGAALERLSLSGGPSVKLGYRLLPGFAANRLQGLWANQNAIQRTEFFRDGLRIYAQSPVIGNGLGSVEGLVTSVQSFYYESKYVHNHYIQVLAEMGIPGLLAFLAILGSAAVTLWKRRREGEEDALLPALCACLAMAALHAAAEAVWSLGQYQTMALLVLSMIAVCFGRPVTRLTSKTAALASSALLCLFSAVFAWLLYGNLAAERAYAEIQAGTRIQDAYSMTNLARRDRYGWAQYKLDMAVNAASSPVEEFAQTAASYAQDCRKLRVHSINFSLERYVYLPQGRYEELFTASREGIPQKASVSRTWQEEFSLYEEALRSDPEGVLDDIQWFADQVLQTEQMMHDYNADRMEPVTLTGDNLAFLERIQAVKATGATGADAAALLGLT